MFLFTMYPQNQEEIRSVTDLVMGRRTGTGFLVAIGFFLERNNREYHQHVYLRKEKIN